jgi:hypothetical protein
MKNFCAHFSNLNPKKQKKIWLPRAGGARQVQIASRAIVHCVHEKFLRAFFKSQSKKTKKIILASKGRWCPTGANRLASTFALCA